jgi:signal recognition particle subunit SRP54
MGSGTSVQDVNKLLKQHKQMQIMMKRVKKMGGTKQFLARGLPPGLPPGMLPR